MNEDIYLALTGNLQVQAVLENMILQSSGPHSLFVNRNRKPRRQDALTVLLFRLPAELRLQIYEYLARELIIKVSNRRSYRWLGISREVFLDAGPLLYSTKPLYFWIDARISIQGRSLDHALKRHINSYHPENAKWAFDVVRSSMLTQVTLEVHARTIGENLQSLLLRFAEMAIQFRKYNALEHLHISLRPQYNNAHHKALFRSFKTAHLQETTVRDSWTMRRLCRAAQQIKTQLPRKCDVKWYLPGEKLSDVMRSQVDVVQFMESLWAFVCERSETGLDDLLSEQEPKPAWRPKQSR